MKWGKSTRTYGMSTDCAGCRFWSEMIAMSENGGPVKAVCLADGGPMNNEYTFGHQSCSGWKSGYLGAVDAPPLYGEEICAEYINDEGESALRACQGMTPAAGNARREI